MSKQPISWIYITAQFIGWGLFYSLIFILNVVLGKFKVTPTLFLFVFEAILLSVIVTHIIRYVILKLNWLKLSVIGIIWRSLLAAVVFGVFYELIDVSFGKLLPHDFYLDKTLSQYSLSKFIGGVVGNTFLFSVWFSFYYTYLFIEKSRKQEIKSLQYEASKNEVELKNLREQINPHFLFNSLNSIKALVEIDKDEAKIAITKLSNLLRKSIQLSKHKLITLKEELEIVDNYIDLEKIRFEERINSQFNIDSAVLFCKIPPLMVQTLVENAIKHGLSKTINGGILKVTMKKEVNIVSILIENTGNLNQISKSEGIGVANTKKRLNILFGRKATFKIYQKDEFVCAEIKIICKL